MGACQTLSSAREKTQLKVELRTENCESMMDYNGVWACLPAFGQGCFGLLEGEAQLGPNIDQSRKKTVD